MTMTARRATERIPTTGANLLVDCLDKVGVECIFGIPGAKIDSVFNALVDGGPRLASIRQGC
ncbi:thiamine pyrophosphate-binding protein [Streptosporangium subroseum]|uniref:thiamine pyrophosphate-binding protein n=1 Tax=Streptosporangium subroseum TaxID=106412 RepID=UPI0034221DE6